MQSGKILIVDDNKELAFALEIRLRANHYQTLLAENGASAISLALMERPFAIILDLSLPDGDGFAVLKKLRGLPELSSVPVIIVTADHSPANKKQALDGGARAFLEKPFDYRSLLVVLREIELAAQDQLFAEGEAPPNLSKN
jgi:two-component system KDP operon response regulator KdpE